MINKKLLFSHKRILMQIKKAGQNILNRLTNPSTNLVEKNNLFFFQVSEIITKKTANHTSTV